MNFDAVAAGGFGAIGGLLGHLDDGFAGGVIEVAEAEAAGDANLLAAADELAMSERRTKPVGQIGRSIQRRVGRDDSELAAGEAAIHIFHAAVVDQELSDAAQDFIRARMAEALGESVEAIDLADDARNGAAASPREGNLRGHALLLIVRAAARLGGAARLGAPGGLNGWPPVRQVPQQTPLLIVAGGQGRSVTIGAGGVGGP